MIFMIFFPKSNINELSPVKEKLNTIFFLQMAFIQNNKKMKYEICFHSFCFKETTQIKSSERINVKNKAKF